MPRSKKSTEKKQYHEVQVDSFPDLENYDDYIRNKYDELSTGVPILIAENIQLVKIPNKGRGYKGYLSVDVIVKIPNTVYSYRKPLNFCCYINSDGLTQYRDIVKALNNPFLEKVINSVDILNKEIRKDNQQIYEAKLAKKAQKEKRCGEIR